MRAPGQIILILSATNLYVSASITVWCACISTLKHEGTLMKTTILVTLATCVISAGLWMSSRAIGVGEGIAALAVLVSGCVLLAVTLLEER